MDGSAEAEHTISALSDDEAFEVCIPLPLPKPQQKRSWLIDPGSEMGVVSRADMKDVDATNAPSSSKPVSLTTANGKRRAGSVADVKVKVPDHTFSILQPIHL